MTKYRETDHSAKTETSTADEFLHVATFGLFPKPTPETTHTSTVTDDKGNSATATGSTHAKAIDNATSILRLETQSSPPDDDGGECDG